MPQEDAAVCRAGIIGPDAATRPELAIQQVLSEHGAPPINYHGIDVAEDALGWFEDLLEFLPKSGFAGVEVLGSLRAYAGARSAWRESASETGYVDTLTFSATHDRLPVGHNLTLGALERLLRRSLQATHLDSPVLILGAASTSRAAISALVRVEAERFFVFDPRPGRAEELVSNAIASGVASSRIEAISQLAYTPAVRAVVDLLPVVLSRQVWQQWPLRTHRSIPWALRRPPGGDDRIPGADLEIDVRALCVERTLSARELFTGDAVPETAAAAAAAVHVQGQG
jgi:shikimate 5-dehydrogenase